MLDRITMRINTSLDSSKELSRKFLSYCVKSVVVLADTLSLYWITVRDRLRRVGGARELDT
jgi:hypothetical protein